MSELRGASEMRDRLRKIAQQFPDRVAAAIYAEANVEMLEAKRRTPVKTGFLRASGRVAEPVRSGRNISCELSFGTDYAIYVHENLEAHHPVGQARFLASVLDESRSFMAARIAERIHLEQA